MAQAPTSCTRRSTRCASRRRGVRAEGRADALPRVAGAPRGNGFTLLELIVALAVLAVLIGIGAPSFRSLVEDAGLSRAVGTLDGALRYARSEAIKRGQSVGLCARGTDTTCGADWTQGWLVYADDPDAGTQGALDASDTIVRYVAPVAAGLTVKAAALVRPDTSLSVKSDLRFSPRGRLDWTVGSFTLCDARGASHARAVLLNGAGALRRERGDGSTLGTPKDALGAAVTCP